MLIAGLGVVSALAFVLGLGAVSLYAVNRWGRGLLRGSKRLPMEVVQRIPLGPKTAMAVVRVGGKVMAVSVGEGGVRPLFELNEADRLQVLATSTVPHALISSEAATRSMAAAPSSIAGAAHTKGTKVETDTDHSGDFQTILSLSLNSATRLAALICAITAATTASPLHGQSANPTLSPPNLELPAISPPTSQPPTVPGLPTGSAIAESASAMAATATPATAAVTGQGPASPYMVTVPAREAQDRAQAAGPAPIAAGDAVMRMLPQMDVQLGGNGESEGLHLNGTVGIVVMMGLLTLLPTLLLMMTGFTRILVVLHFLKQAMGTQSAPPSHLLAGLALLLTAFVMGPTLNEVNRTAIAPWLDGQMTQTEMMQTGVRPFREFMLRQTRPADVETFVRLSRMEQPDTIDDVPLHVIMSAFVASELRTAFQIGFAIYLPFIIIDAVVASVLMSMGMFMLPPAMISLPFKLLLFVLVDGWSLTITSLVESFR